jgi:DNA-binding SARP family transcriptional activator/WD40 repeat protein/energy-coupling factor transporter ATP-binding protein EcfA2
MVTTPARPATGRPIFRVLGPMEVAEDDRIIAVGGPKERQVLAVLLSHAPHTVTIDVLAEGLWADRPPRSAERTLHAYVARLRKALEPGRRQGTPSSVLVTDGRGYRLDVDGDRFDATRFEELARRGSEQLRAGDPQAAQTLVAALDLWRGDAYVEFADVEPCAREARRLTEIRLNTLEDRVDAELAEGAGPELVADIERQLFDHPFRERLWGQLMLALYRSGRQGDALEAYQRARAVLVDELGLEPGPELRRLEASILDQDPGLDAPKAEPEAAHGRMPLALEAVGPAFVGRIAELAWLRTGWDAATRGDGRFLSLLGPEGIGKTRLVTELASQVQPGGAVVLYARCDHAHRGPRALLDQALRSGGASLARLDDPAVPLDDLAGAFARFLPTWTQGRPVLLVLDDLHLADTATLEVVADMAGWCASQPMLAVGAFRTDDAPSKDRDHGDGDEPATQLTLGGLDVESVGRICRLYREHGWTADDVERVHDLTSGVPLEVHEQASELARQWTAREVSEASDRAAGARARLVTSRAEVADGVEGIGRLLEQRRSQLAGRAVPVDRMAIASDLCPYKGLARFETADAPWFFGRERLAAEVVARLAASRLVAVVGPSGSGKSSLVRAGVLPALAEGVLGGTRRWRTVTLCPGARPSSELASQLRSPGTGDGDVDDPLLVFVDQFEEVFTHCDRVPDRVEFVERLARIVEDPATALVLAIRADHLGACAAHPILAELLAGNDVLVGPMTDAELRRAIEAPAGHAGLALERGLADIIVGEVAGRTGALPLLSTALSETWQRRRGRTLTVSGYQAAGGVNRALARLAEDAYVDLGAGPQAAARRILLRLCDAGDDGVPDLRRRLPIDEVAAPADPDAQHALEMLVERRLLTVDRDTVEVAHEALLREWPRLRGWFEEDVEGRRVHRRLGDAARSWEAGGEDASELYRGTRLDAASEWAARHGDDLNPVERRFVDASRAEADRQVDEARRRVRDKTRSNRRLRGLLAGVGVLLVLAIVAGLVAMNQRDRAGTEARAATARELAGESTLALDVDPELGMLLALEAIRTTRSAGEPVRPEAIGALHEAVQASRLEVAVPEGGPYVDASPDGRFIVTSSSTPGEAVVREAGTGEPRHTLTGPPVDVFGVSFSPDSGRVAVSYATADAPAGTPAAVVWDAATGEELTRFSGPAGSYSGPAFSPDGRSLTAAGDSLVVWDMASGAERFEVVPEEFFGSAVFHPDGATIIATEPSLERVGLFSAADGSRIGTMATPGFTPESVAVDPAGTMVALASQPSRAVEILAVASGALVRSIPVGDVAYVDWSVDGDRLAISGGNQGPVRIVDVASGQDVMVLRGHVDGSVDVAFIGGDHLVSTSYSDLRIWDVTPAGPGEVGAIAPQTGLPGLFMLSPDGTEVLVTGRAGTAELLSTVTGEPLRPPVEDLQLGPFFAAASPDWRYLGVTRNDGRGEILGLASATHLRDTPACTSPRLFSPDGSLSTSTDGCCAHRSTGTPRPSISPPTPTRAPASSSSNPAGRCST